MNRTISLPQVRAVFVSFVSLVRSDISYRDARMASLDCCMHSILFPVILAIGNTMQYHHLGRFSMTRKNSDMVWYVLAQILKHLSEPGSKPEPSSSLE